ncbi:hypothetical protein BGX21_007273 [Mortierella sp. AD011]|nr:hypothetical protein BGX20_008273 [Mortierella sp. AD010]KAF9398794.1 hypothetical protein BGX21_007273 [Mortierella sp. AD011]
MAARTEASVHQPPSQYQKQQQKQQQQQQQQQRRKPQVYTLYPDPPIKRLSTAQYQPQSPSPSQIQSKYPEKNAKPSASSPTSRQAETLTNGRSQPTQLNVSTRVNNQNVKQQSSNTQNNNQQQVHSPSSRTPLTPISPSNVASKGAVAGNPVSAQQDIGGAPRQRQQQQQQQGPQHQPIYGGSVPRQSLSSPSAQHPSHGQLDVATFKQFPYGSSTNRQQSNGSNKSSPTSASPVSPKQGPFSSPTSSPRTDRLFTEIPSSSLALSFDRDSDLDQPQDQEKHQKQALQYQKKLRQRPPKQGGDDTDDDSDAGSIVSYRRSIHRLSMTYNGRPGVPNISLFTPSQRPRIVQHVRSTSGPKELSESPKLMATVVDQKGEQQRSQHQQHKRQQSGSQPSYHQNQRGIQERKDDSGRPRIVRSNTEESSPAPRFKDIEIPERSTSADNIFPKNDNGGNRSRQQKASESHQQQNPQFEHYPYPSNHLPYQPNNNGKSPSSPVRGPYDPRPSHESAQNARSQHPHNRAEPPRRSGDSASHGTSAQDRSKSPGGTYYQNPPRGAGQSHHPIPAAARGAGAGGYANNNLNMHPAHHFPSGGYVRPEEAVGPSNPMPEKAEDYVRQGIEYHELGEISKATNYFRTAAELGDPVGMLMYGLSVRHGWGCTANRVLAFQYLQKSAEHAVGDLNSRDSFASSAAKGELVLAIYELGICFRHGWGVEKSKKTAAYYFEIAANLGDPDAQNDLAWCYYHGIGVKKDMYKSAKYYRLAAAQGQGTIGNQWIWKDKYGGPTSPTPVEKGNSHNHALRAY